MVVVLLEEDLASGCYLASLTLFVCPGGLGSGQVPEWWGERRGETDYQLLCGVANEGQSTGTQPNDELLWGRILGIGWIWCWTRMGREV
jgi:hypothetical protein